MNLQESGEMYLETILILSKSSNNVRSLDIAEYMGYSKPSISRAMGVLKSGGFVEADSNGYLHLTAEGKAIAEKIYERHTVLTQALVFLGVDEETASNDACKIEHVISDKTFKAIKEKIMKNN